MAGNALRCGAPLCRAAQLKQQPTRPVQPWIAMVSQKKLDNGRWDCSFFGPTAATAPLWTQPRNTKAHEALDSHAGPRIQPQPHTATHSRAQPQIASMPVCGVAVECSALPPLPPRFCRSGRFWGRNCAGPPGNGQRSSLKTCDRSGGCCASADGRSTRARVALGLRRSAAVAAPRRLYSSVHNVTDPSDHDRHVVHTQNLHCPGKPRLKTLNALNSMEAAVVRGNAHLGPTTLRGGFSHSARTAAMLFIPGTPPENHPPTEACMIPSKQHRGNSGPWDPWLPVVENSRHFTQRAVHPLSTAFGC